jgi:hypothetical protein
MRSALLIEHTDTPTPSQTDYIAEETGVGMIAPTERGEIGKRASVGRVVRTTPGLWKTYSRDAPRPIPLIIPHRSWTRHGHQQDVPAHRSSVARHTWGMPSGGRPARPTASALSSDVALAVAPLEDREGLIICSNGSLARYLSSWHPSRTGETPKDINDLSLKHGELFHDPVSERYCVRSYGRPALC